MKVGPRGEVIKDGRADSDLESVIDAEVCDVGVQIVLSGGAVVGDGGRFGGDRFEPRFLLVEFGEVAVGEVALAVDALDVLADAGLVGGDRVALLGEPGEGGVQVGDGLLLHGDRLEGLADSRCDRG